MTPTAVLSTVDREGRYPRHAQNMGTTQLTRLANFSDNWDVKTLAEGVFYADDSGRTTGTVSMALRYSTPWQVATLIAKMIDAGLTRQNEVAGWLNREALTVLSPGK